MARPRILSGMRPTGALHLGNLMGALDNWVRLQDSHECFFAIVDWHSLTTDYADPSAIRESILKVATDWLAGGAGSRPPPALRPEPGAGARGAAPAALDDRARALAGARADLQGAAAAAPGPGPLDLRLSRVPAAADGRHHHLQGGRGSGRGGPGPAHPAVARGRPPLQQPLRAGLPGAADAAAGGE